MSFRRPLIRLCALLAAVALTRGCGSGESPIAPPDPPRPATVAVSPATAELSALGASVQLTAGVRDQNGNAVQGAAVSWTTSAAAVATVSASGMVTAAGNGTATITATAGSASGSAAVAVAQEVSAVAVTPAADTVVVGGTQRLAAEAADANGHPVAGAEFAWASGDTLVAVVDDAGLVTGVGVGEAEVTATAAAVTGRTVLTVVAPAPTVVAVTPDTLALPALGQTAQLDAEVRDQIGRVMEGIRVSWSSADPTVAAVDSAGLVTAVGSGVATITARAGEAAGYALVRVMQSAGSVVVSPPAGTVALGDTLRLAAEAFDANGHLIERAAFAWSSSDGSVATVDATGLVRGVAEGAATITATTGSAAGSSEITVENADRAVLVALYEAAGGGSWAKRENWGSDRPLGEWHGVETDGEGRVTSLELRENGLAGSLPSEIGDLAALESLDLGGNGLTGPIPPELGRLARLERLVLDGNRLTGPMPTELGDLANLEDLRLARNPLTGRIPAELGRLSKLEAIWLDETGVSGSIPPELGNLSNLGSLWIVNSDLSGPIPPELGRLSRLWRLVLYGNRLTGPVPAELGNLSNLGVLGLEQNRLTGPFPPSVLGITGLEDLRFQENAGLCIPGTTGFVEWAVAVDDRSGPFCNEADRTALEALYSSAGGDGWTNSGGWLTDVAIGDWHGVTTDSLGRIVEVDLAANGLDGSVPDELGYLTRMTVLKLGGNALSGRLPQSLARVPLREFRYAGTELCALPAAPFQEWLAGIELHEGTGVECARVSDRDVLTALYEATDGPNWTNSQNWLTDAPLEEWHGVDVDGEGRVDYLNLSDNGLTGPILPELGDLSRLERLVLYGNGLEGEIPPELGNLSRLTRLSLHSNAVRGSLPAELGRLINLEYLAVGHNRLTGPIPPEIGRLSELRQLHAGSNLLTGPLPPELGSLSNLEVLSLQWNPLTGPIPPELGRLSSLRRLNAGRGIYWAELQCGKLNPDLRPCYPALTGTIPRELGNLSNLEYLDLGWNDLTGPIPTELGDLSRLRTLRLESNRLAGPIPPEIGGLSSLAELLLANNKLTGPVPSTIGGLSGLEQLALARNELTGALPPELGRLAELRTLDAEYNALTGHIPPQLGRLAHLEELILGFNDLSGSVPAEFSGLASLRKLILPANAAMSGPLPDGLPALDELEFLVAGGTGLCAPSDARFDAWLGAMASAHVAMCAGNAAAYLVQAVQSRDLPVPLVAGDDALVRVFPTAAVETHAGIPPVRVRFYINGRETHVEDIPGKPGLLPTEVDEGSLETSANAVIPGSLIQPGLEMVVEIDPDSTLDPSLGVAQRVPETGRMAVDVYAIPFHLTLVPFLRSDDPDLLVLDLTERMAADPHNDPALWGMKTLLAVNDGFELTRHEPVWTSDNSNYGPLQEVEALKVLEGGTGHYMAILSEAGVSTGISETGTSLIFVTGRYRMDEPLSGLIAHEMGHAMTLGHAPGCIPGSRDRSKDPAYPHSTGIIGVWGYDFRDGGALVRPSTADVMAFCGGRGLEDRWISDYNFTKMVRHRLRYDMPAPASHALLLWGGVDEAGVPFLEPAFVVDAPAVLPDSTGAYTLSGAARDGRELFSLDFPIYAMPDSEGNGSFVFAVPTRPGWANALASITLEGPGGSFTLDGETDLPMSIVRDSRTGQVRGFLRSGPATTAADGRATAPRMLADPGLERLFSRGIPDPAAWRR